MTINFCENFTPNQQFMSKQNPFPSLFNINQPKPLVIAIRALLAGGLVLSSGWTAIVKADSTLPVPVHAAAQLNNSPVDLGASYGAATADVVNHTLTVHQHSDKVALDWNSFNIGAGNSVQFDQPSASAIALNNIHDGNASQILGSLTANGEVYLINPNGFVFGANSQVNVNSFIASTLGISQADLVTGISAVFDTAYKTNGSASAALQGSGQFYLKNSQGDFVLDNSGNKIPISINIQPGAQITSNANGGLVLMAAPTIDNQGSISTPSGQVILAAAQDKVYLQVSNDARMRGMLVEVGTGGKVSNEGAVLAQTGNVSMIGFAVNQNGIVSATTSINQNGSVRLLAEEGVQTPSGDAPVLTGLSTLRAADLGDGLGVNATVNLGSGSVTSVNPDNSAATALAVQQQPQSYVEISGHNVNLLSNSLLQAHSGTVDIKALNSPVVSTATRLTDNTITTARINLQTGSQIDVSGLQNVADSVANDIVSIKLQSNELRNSPLLRKGEDVVNGQDVVYGQTVNVDIRNATVSYNQNANPVSGNPVAASIPIADIIGAVQQIASNVQQRSITGGTINLNSSGDVIVNQGSILNISGGSVAYSGTDITVSQLVSGGQIYDLSKAPTNLHYDALTSLTYHDSGYVQGVAAGNLNISSYAVLLDGTLSGHTVQGDLQRNILTPVADSAGNFQLSPYSAAVGSSLTLNMLNTNSSLPQNVHFSNNFSGLALGPNDMLGLGAHAAIAPAPITINAEMLNGSGIQNVTISTAGAVRVDSGVKLKLPANGLLNLTGANLDLQGSISIPAGTFKFQQNNQFAYTQADAVVLGAASLLDVSGLWINDNLDSQSGQAVVSPIAINAGSVNLKVAQGNLHLETGSRILANGGGWEQNNLSVTAGKAGSITLAAANTSVYNHLSSLVVDGGNLGDYLAAWGIKQNGSLSLNTSEIIIGSHADAVSNQALVLSQNFLQQGGFASYNLVSNIYGLTVSNNVNLVLQQHNWQLDSNSILAATGSSIELIGKPGLSYAGLRNSVDLSLSFAEVTNQNQHESLQIKSGASISTDPGGSVTLNSDTSIIDYGVIYTPGGNISLNITYPGNDNGYFASQGIWLGAGSQLLAQGVLVPQAIPPSSVFLTSPLISGLYSGNVLDGGNVHIQANRGYIVADVNSLIDVSGTSATVDFIQSGTDQGITSVAKHIASSGGNISLIAGEGILDYGRMDAHLGGAGASAGSLLVELNRTLLNEGNTNQKFPDQLPNSQLSSILNITSDSANMPSAPTATGNIPLAYSDQAWLNNNVLNAAGFGSISLQTDAQFAVNNNNVLNSAIKFIGNVQLYADRQIILDTPLLETQTANSQVTLDAPYVALGSSLINVNQVNQGYELAPAATGGSGTFNINNGQGLEVQGIDLIGGLAFNGFSTVNLVSQGGLRMRGDASLLYKNYLGELNVAGDLNITANQIYPATLTHFTINDANNTVRFNLAQLLASTPVLSAGGYLNIHAANIVQASDIEVPFGTLILNADKTLTLATGSTTSVSGANTVVPFGIGAGGGTEWLYPVDNTGLHNIVISGSNLPHKILQLTANTLDLQTGANINLAGGGDLYAYEFITGNGGSVNVLDTPVSNRFAVIPGIDNILTPYDPQLYSSAGLSMGESVFLNAGAGLLAGWYTILPAQYALLPGAFLVTPQTGTAGQYLTSYAAAGSSDNTIVTGYYGVAATGIQSSIYNTYNNNQSIGQGFEVQPGSIFTGSITAKNAGQVVDNVNQSTPAQYTAYTANAFFAAQAALHSTVLPQLPQDAGNLLISASNALILDASLQAQAAGTGLGGQVDISAAKLEVVGNNEDLAQVASGTVGLVASQLNNFNAPSLLLGGKRSLNANGQLLSITATDLTVYKDVQLTGAELLLAAGEQIDVQYGAHLTSTGNSGQGGGVITLENQPIGQNSAVNSNGALLRLSAAGQAGVVRDLPISKDNLGQPITGTLTIENNVVLSAAGSILLDASKDTSFNGSIAMNGGALAFNSSEISLGDVPGNTSGLVLSALPGNLGDLSLNSASDINIYGGFVINSRQVDITAAAINGFANTGQTFNINATQVNLANNGASSRQTGGGNGAFVVNAQNIVLGSGQYAINGFGDVSFTATQAINGAAPSVVTSTGTTISNGTAGNSAIASPAVLTVNADLQLNAGHFSGGNGATTSINTGNHVLTVNSLGFSSTDLPIGLGVSWTFIAAAINSSARFELPSGNLNMTATSGDINLNNGSFIDLAGAMVNFAGAVKYADGGGLRLISELGNVNLDANAGINLAGYQLLSNAGSLTVQASQGQFNWNCVNGSVCGANILASGLTGGNFSLNAHQFAGGFANMNQELIVAGFNNTISLELQSGDVAIDNTVIAKQFSLNVDQGSVLVNAGIDASGASAGSVALYGRNGIILGANANIDAAATGNNQAGGSVILDTVHRDDTGTGLLDLSAGGQINVSGGAGGHGGAVHLRSGRNDSNDSVAVTAINTQIIGATPLAAVLEATRIYTTTQISATDIYGASGNGGWFLDTANFMAHAPLLSGSGSHTLQILPGIEVRSPSNLTLSTAWDFESAGTGWNSTSNTWNSGWRYGVNANLPGFLTLRAAGDLNIDASISDGLANSPLLNQNPGIYFEDIIQPGLSWSYNLLAGGSVNLAASYLSPDPLNLSGNIDTQVMVRTGTGTINISAGQDILFRQNTTSNILDNSNNASAVYTVGTTSVYTIDELLSGQVPGYPALPANQSLTDYLVSQGLDNNKLNQLLRYGFFDENLIGLNTNPGYLYAEYPTSGGNINLTAGRDILGVQTGQQSSAWLVRAANDGTSPTPTAWGINISGDMYNTPLNQQGTLADGVTILAGKDGRNFNQNVGALGGGNVTVEAGGNVQDLSVMIPATGKPIGTMSTPGVWVQNASVINGGGNLQLSAGNNITGGEFYLGQGNANLTAGGGFQQTTIPGSALTIGVVLDVANSVVNLQAREDINLATILNPSLLAQNLAVVDYGQNISTDTRFFSYGIDSAVNLQALAGNIIFENNYQDIAALYSIAQSSTSSHIEYSIYPGILKAAAMSGDIRIANSFSLFPSAHGTLQLLAKGNLGIDPTAQNGQSISVIMSDTDPNALPSINNPVNSIDGSNVDSLNPTSTLYLTTHAATPVHQGDGNQSMLVADMGNIAFSALNQVSFYLPQAADISAGGNISNLSLTIQNLGSNDVSLIHAGGNISYDTPLDENGIVITRNQSITVSGPGQVQVVAGGNINLGSSNGILTNGNQKNPALSATGASIDLLAGLSDRLDYASFKNYVDFINKYASAGIPITIDFVDFVVNGSVSGTDILSLQVNYVNGNGKNITDSLTLQDINHLQNIAGFSPEILNTAVKQQRQTVLNLQNLAGVTKQQQQDESVLLAGLNSLTQQFDSLPNLNAQNSNNYSDLNLVMKELFQELDVVINLAALTPQSNRADIYLLGTAAIKDLFPGSNYGGDLSMVNSEIKTLAGGDINIATPGGGINVGLPGNKPASALGIVAQAEGDVSILTLGDLTVNQSRVFTLGNGNITAWSAQGNIDAGKGAKSAVFAPPASTLVHADGTTSNYFPPTISGNGIQAYGAGGGGSVYLAAPNGIVDTGEAGIGGKQIVVPTLLVGTNISGPVAGQPPAAPQVPTSGADSAAASAGKAAEKTLGDDEEADEKRKARKKRVVSVFNTDVLGFGKCSVSDVKDGKSGCG